MIKIYGARYLVVVTVCAIFVGQLTLDFVLEMMILLYYMMGFELLYILVSLKNVHKGGVAGTAQFIKLGIIRGRNRGNITPNQFGPWRFLAFLASCGTLLD